jgi:trigger factor
MEKPMKVDVRREAPSRAVLEIELPPDQVSQGKERALARLNQRVEIPGFRRGKAPKTLLERYVGTGTVQEEAVNLLVPDAYSEAVRQAGVRPIAQPEIHVDPLEDGKPLRFVATVDLVPEVKLGDYKAIRIQPTEPSVTDADIESAIEDLRARHAQLESTGERPAEQGDYVMVRIVELSGTQDRFAVGKDYLVEVGGGAYPAELESALVGGVRGQRATATLTGGATITFEVGDVKRRKLPDLSDAFAKTAGGVESVEVLRTSLRERMQGEARDRARRADEQQVVDTLLQGATIELPASLVDHEVLHLVADLEDSLGRRGITLERYLQVQEKTDEQLRGELRPSAEKRLRTQLALDELARTMGLEPTQEEIDREAENVARGSQQDLAKVREWLAQSGRLESLIAALRRRKALAALMAIARGEPA